MTRINIFFFIAIFFCVFSINAQSKKAQIEMLNYRIDSLKQLVINEKIINSNSLNEISQLNNSLSQQKSSISSLNDEVGNLTLKIQLNQSELSLLNYEVSRLTSELQLKQVELSGKTSDIVKLKGQLTAKSDSLMLVLIELEKLKASIVQLNINKHDLIKKQIDSLNGFNSKNVGIVLIPPPKFSINDDELIELVIEKMSFTCPEEDVLGNRGPAICVKEIMGIQYFEYRNKIRFLASVGFSFNGSHADVGNNGFVLMQYTGSKWELIDFFEYQAIDEMQNGNAMKINNFGVLGKNSVGFFHELCSTAAGEGPFCSMILIGTYADNIGLFLYEASASDESYGMGKKGYENHYSIVETDIEWNELHRIRNDYRTKTKAKYVLRFNSKNMKFEVVK